MYYDLQCTPQDYLPCMIRMMKEVEKNIDTEEENKQYQEYIAKHKILGTIADGFSAIADGIVAMSKAIVSVPGKLFDFFKSTLKAVTPDIVEEAFGSVLSKVKEISEEILLNGKIILK